MDSYYRRNQKHHREHRRRKLHLKLIVILIVLIYSAYCLFRPLPAITATTLPAPKPASSTSPTLLWPVSAESSIGTVGAGVLATSSKYQAPIPTASIAKLITALTVLSKFPLSPGQQGPTITLGAADVALYNEYYAENGSLVKVRAGEQLTEYEALEAMLLPSGNNMADSLAIWAFGSLKEYREAAENEITSLGLNQTVIGSDASGFLPDTKSTPSDLIKLGQIVLTNPLLKQIVSQKTATVPVAGKIKNTNYLLGTGGIIGIKTGNSTQAGGCLLFAANYDLEGKRVTIIGAVQHAPTMLAAMRAATPLLKSAEKSFQIKTVAAAGQTIASYSAPWLGEPVPIVAQQSLSLPVWPGKEPIQSLKYHNYKAPRLIDDPFHSIAAGTVVGNLSAGGDDNEQTTPLILRQQVNPPSVVWRLTHPF